MWNETLLSERTPPAVAVFFLLYFYYRLILARRAVKKRTAGWYAVGDAMVDRAESIQAVIAEFRESLSSLSEKVVLDRLVSLPAILGVCWTALTLSQALVGDGFDAVRLQSAFTGMLCFAGLSLFVTVWSSKAEGAVSDAIDEATRHLLAKTRPRSVLELEGQLVAVRRELESVFLRTREHIVAMDEDFIKVRSQTGRLCESADSAAGGMAQVATSVANDMARLLEGLSDTTRKIETMSSTMSEFSGKLSDAAQVPRQFDEAKQRLQDISVSLAQTADLLVRLFKTGGASVGSGSLVAVAEAVASGVEKLVSNSDGLVQSLSAAGSRLNAAADHVADELNETIGHLRSAGSNFDKLAGRVGETSEIITFKDAVEVLRESVVRLRNSVVQTTSFGEVRSEGPGDSQGRTLLEQVESIRSSIDEVKALVATLGPSGGAQGRRLGVHPPVSEEVRHGAS